MFKIITQSSHNFAHVTTAQLSWYVQNCDLIGPVGRKFEHTELLQDFKYQLLKSLSDDP